VGVGNEGEADLASLQNAVEAGRIEVLYVVDPGPDGSLGDVSWIVEARNSGHLPVVIYQGVHNTKLAGMADIVLPGAAWVEKDATYTNDAGVVQAASKVIVPPGEAVEDWQILTSVAVAFGLPFEYRNSGEVRADIGRLLAGTPGYETLASQSFHRPQPLKHWLQASNPMERWKWDVMFQDLPPVKGHNVQMEGAPQPAVIPLKLVTEEVSRTSD
jgi:predicted molibdopterin-dependent oxidoreductase YjgC